MKTEKHPLDKFFPKKNGYFPWHTFESHSHAFTLQPTDDLYKQKLLKETDFSGFNDFPVTIVRNGNTFEIIQTVGGEQSEWPLLQPKESEMRDSLYAESMKRLPVKPLPKHLQRAAGMIGSSLTYCYNESGIAMEAAPYDAFRQALLQCYDKSDGKLNSSIYDPHGTNIRNERIDGVEKYDQLFERIAKLNKEGMRFRLFFAKNAQGASAEGWINDPHKIDFTCRALRSKNSAAETNINALIELSAVLHRVVQWKEHLGKRKLPEKYFETMIFDLDMPHAVMLDKGKRDDALAWKMLRINKPLRDSIKNLKAEDQQRSLQEKIDIMQGKKSAGTKERERIRACDEAFKALFSDDQYRSLQENATKKGAERQNYDIRFSYGGSHLVLRMPEETQQSVQLAPDEDIFLYNNLIKLKSSNETPFDPQLDASLWMDKSKHYKLTQGETTWDIPENHEAYQACRKRLQEIHIPFQSVNDRLVTFLTRVRNTDTNTTARDGLGRELHEGAYESNYENSAEAEKSYSIPIIIEGDEGSGYSLNLHSERFQEEDLEQSLSFAKKALQRAQRKEYGNPSTQIDDYGRVIKALRPHKNTKRNSVEELLQAAIFGLADVDVDSRKPLAFQRGAQASRALQDCADWKKQQSELCTSAAHIFLPMWPSKEIDAQTLSSLSKAEMKMLYAVFQRMKKNGENQSACQAALAVIKQAIPTEEYQREQEITGISPKASISSLNSTRSR